MKITFLLLAYEQASTIDEAIAGAFGQVCEPCEIILSDDASRDSTFERMCSAAQGYSGPHDVRTRRSAQNRGLLQHLVDAVSECSGDLIILAAGDDISEPDRTARIVEEWRNMGCGTALIHSDWQGIDAQGERIVTPSVAHDRKHDLEALAKGETGPLGATCAMTRSLLTDFAPVNDAVRFEDRVFPFRALLLGGEIRYIDEKLVRYRIGGGVSHDVPTDPRELLTRHMFDRHSSTIVDAHQRLADCREKRSHDRALMMACRRTIVDQEAKIAMADERRLTAKLLLFLSRGARPVPLLKHYLKLLAVRLRPTAR